MLRVNKVKYLKNYSLQLTFTDGKTKTIDLESIVRKGGYYFEPLQDIDVFKNVSMDDMNYSICWPNGADLSPDALYEMGIEEKSKTATKIRKPTLTSSKRRSKALQ
jgi:hypothetical protein